MAQASPNEKRSRRLKDQDLPNPRVFTRLVSPPATARTSAKKNHFPHHLERASAVGGPVGRAGKLGAIKRADFTEDAWVALTSGWVKIRTGFALLTLYGGKRKPMILSILSSCQKRYRRVVKFGYQLGESRDDRRCVNVSKVYFPVWAPSSPSE
jgi:hypothetical protein